MTKNITEAILKRDRNIIFLSLIGIVVVAWVYTIHLTRSMSHSEMGLEMVFPQSHVWVPTDFYLNFLMGTVMQVAMMTPTVAPGMVLTVMLLSMPEDALEARKQKPPLKRMGTPEEVANDLQTV